MPSIPISLGGGSNEFIFKAVIFSVAIMFLMPVSISVLVEKNVEGDTVNEFVQNSILDNYKNFTGSSSTNVHEQLWVLGGIFTPYGIGIDSNGNEYQTSDYFYTPDHWISSARVIDYEPNQYLNTPAEYTVSYDADNKCYRYVVPDGQTTQDGFKNGDLYNSVTMDIDHQSDVFFTPSGKTEIGNNFYYDFTGYRYSFIPCGDYYALDVNGDTKQVIATSTSLNLIWFNYYGQSSGISGQLVLSGSDSGLGFISANDIVTAFNSTNSISKFSMVFNGVECWIYVKLNPYFLSQGMSIEDCYNAGYWSIMVTSRSTDVATYTSTEYSMNMSNIWDTFVDLFTFNMDDYGMSPMMKTIASLTISVCLYAFLLSIGVTCWPVLLLAGVVALVQAIAIADINPFPDVDLWPFD